MVADRALQLSVPLRPSRLLQYLNYAVITCVMTAFSLVGWPRWAWWATLAVLMGLAHVRWARHRQMHTGLLELFPDGALRWQGIWYRLTPDSRDLGWLLVWALQPLVSQQAPAAECRLVLLRDAVPAGMWPHLRRWSRWRGMQPVADRSPAAGP